MKAKIDLRQPEKNIVHDVLLYISMEKNVRKISGTPIKDTRRRIDLYGLYLLVLDLHHEGSSFIEISNSDKYLNCLDNNSEQYLKHYNFAFALALPPPALSSIALVSSLSRMCGGDMPGSNTLGSLSTHASGWSFVSAGFAE